MAKLGIAFGVLVAILTAIHLTIQIVKDGTDLHDKLSASPPASTPAQPTSPPPAVKKKRLETGAVPDPEPSFLSNPWKWLEWNQRQNQAKCDPYDPDKKRWCGYPY